MLVCVQNKHQMNYFDGNKENSVFRYSSFKAKIYR